MHNREQPGAEIRPRLPEMRFGNRAQQSLLHEIIGAIGAPSECPGIAAKPRDLSLDEAMKFGHCFSFVHRPPGLGRQSVDVDALCNSRMNSAVLFDKML